MLKEVSIITVDANHCQRETLGKIAEKKAHVVVQVKNNQPKLREAAVSQFQAVFYIQKEKVVTEIKQKHHGQKRGGIFSSEKRNCQKNLKISSLLPNYYHYGTTSLSNGKEIVDRFWKQCIEITQQF